MALLADDPSIDKTLDAMAADITARVLRPWQAGLKRWLRSDAASTSPMASDIASFTPNAKLLARIIYRWSVKLADLGGQMAIDRIAEGLFGTGKREGPRVREARNLTLAERLDLGRGWNALTGGQVFNLRDPRLLAEIRNTSIKVTGRVTQSMIDDALAVMTRNFRRGLGPAALAGEFDRIFPVTYKNRGLTIARTTGLQAQSTLTHATYEQNGVPGKQWLTLQDDRTRHSHSAAHGQVRPIDKPFDVGGGQLAKPRDPAGSAANVINCRCDELAVMDPSLMGMSDAEARARMPAQPWLGEDRDAGRSREALPLRRPTSPLPWRDATPSLRAVLASHAARV